MAPGWWLLRSLQPPRWLQKRLRLRRWCAYARHGAGKAPGRPHVAALTWRGAVLRGRSVPRAWVVISRCNTSVNAHDTKVNRTVRRINAYRLAYLGTEQNSPQRAFIGDFPRGRVGLGRTHQVICFFLVIPIFDHSDDRANTHLVVRLAIVFDQLVIAEDFFQFQNSPFEE